jgi:hypothetical protein
MSKVRYNMAIDWLKDIKCIHIGEIYVVVTSIGENLWLKRQQSIKILSTDIVSADLGAWSHPREKKMSCT